MDSEYREYPYRFVIVLLFTLPSFINGMCWVVFSSISNKTAETYDVDPSIVTLVPMLYMIVYIPINFPSNWILDTKGIRKGVIIGAVMTALGASIRCMLNLHFIYAILGQFFCAVAQPFILNAPAKIATYWFKENNRPVATAVLSVINIIGTAVGFLVPSMIVDEHELNRQTVRSQMFKLMLIEFILSLVGALLVVVLFREKPPKPPSFGAESQKTPFRESLKIMFRNKNFVWLLIGFSTVNGAFNFLGSLLNYVLQPFHVSDDQTSILAGLILFVGIVASFLFSLYIEKTDKYKRVFVVCALLSVSSLTAFSANLYFFKMQWLQYFSVVVIGLSQVPLLPLSFDFGCQVVFPIGEAQVTGVLMTGGQIIGIIQVTNNLIKIVLVQNVYGVTSEKSAFISCIFVTLVLAVGMIGYFVVTEDLRRKKVQKARSINSAASLLDSVQGTN